MDADARVLVIDDDADVRLILQRNLEHAGFEIATAEDAAEGLALVRTWRPDVVVLDLMMPRMDGFAVLDELARDPENRVPVIVLTAMIGSEVKERCLRAGATLVMTKPLEPESLGSEIRRTLAESRSSVELP